MTARVAVVVGNPKPASRTLDSALRVARELTGRRADLVVDLADLGVRLMDWSDPEVSRLVAEVGDADLVVVASPTYKATYTGLLKAVLDQAPGGFLKGVVALPLQVAASDKHALAVDLHLRPVLVELGATVPGAGVFVNESRLTGDHETLVKELAEELESTGTANSLRALLR